MLEGKPKVYNLKLKHGLGRRPVTISITTTAATSTAITTTIHLL